MKLGPKEIKVVNEYFVRPVKNRLKEIFMKKGLPQLRTADEIKQPPVRKDVEDIQAINEFNKRNPRADGGRIGFKESGLVERGPNKGKYFARVTEGGEKIRKFFDTKNEFDSFIKLRDLKKVDVDNLKKVAKDLKQELGRLPTQTEVARKANSNIPAVKRYLNENTDFAIPMSKQEAAKMGGKPIGDNIILADDKKGLKELQNKVDKLNRVNKLDDKGIKFKVIKTQAGNYTTELSYLSSEYRDKLNKFKSTGPLDDLIKEFNQFKKTDLFKNYSKSAAMKAGGVKSAKKQLADIGSKKPDIFNYLLNNKNATIEQIAKDLKIKDGVVRTSLQGLYTDIYKRTADQGAVYLTEFNSNELNSVHSSIKNTKVRLKDRVKNLVIDAYKGDKNLKPLLEKLDNFYTLQSEIKKTPYGKFFAANLDHPVPLNFIRQLKEGADPFNLIKIKPVPEFLNQRAFKAQFDRVLGTAYRTGNKKALEAIVNVQSYLPQEFGGITPDGKIKDYGAKPFSLKTNLAQADFPEVYKRVFNFINNPELQETFKKSKVSFKNLASQEKNIMKQASEYKKQLKKLGEQGFQLSANPMFNPGILKEAFKQAPTLAGAGVLNLLFGVDPTSAIDRASISAEAAFAPQLVKQAAKLGSVGQRIANIGLSPAMAARAARIASPIGIASLAAEGLYQGGKFTKKRIEELRSMTPEQRAELRRQGEAQAFDPFQAAGGGIAKLAGDRSGAMLTSMNPDKDGLPGLLKRGKK
jgi:predicted DNA-binding transcriptional regulator/ribosomal protein L29